jgi:lipopolysaccharide/colanic/teichoic acid biosynthesis glycosyltransferase
MIKRLFDIVVSAVACAMLSPVMLLVALLVKSTSLGPILFLQERVGKNFRRFKIYKFRTMIPDAPNLGGVITIGEDPRITKVGRVLRMTKIDELPQLFNVLLGDMSFVGPRPEAPKYVEMFRDDYEEILTVRPGVTDLASIKYRDEAAVLGQAEDSEREYIERVLPEKIQFAKEYVRRSSLWFDLAVIFRTVGVLLADRLPKRKNKEEQGTR